MNDYERQIMESNDPVAIKQLRISRESTNKMNDFLFNNIINVVEQNDRLFVLGDFCWKGWSSVESVYRNFMERINCKTVFLIWGNHDPKQHHIEKRAAIAKCFSATYDLLITEIEGVVVTMCHYAMLTWDRNHYKSICLLAHSHGTLNPWLDEHLRNHRMLDVGVDNAFKMLGEYRPFSFEEVLEITNKRAGKNSHGGNDD
jgi:calcineurin-like phosphoesterase family protein